MSQCQPVVAVLLLTKNGRRFLQESLPALRNQAARVPFEVVAVDSGSSDGTLELLRQFSVRLYEVPPEEFHHGRTRNLAASLVSSSVEYLVYLTQDATPLEEWLDPLIEDLLEDPRTAGVFSRHVPRPDCNPILARQITVEWLMAGTPHRIVKELTDERHFAENQAYYAYFSNTSSCLRRSAWREHPFSESAEFGEDADWALRVLRAGYRLVYEPRSAVLHSHNYRLWNQFRQNFDHSRAMAAVLGPAPGGGSRRGLLAGLREVLEQCRRDYRYLRYQTPYRRRVKMKWLCYSPLWHLSTRLGGYCGRRSHRSPSLGRGFLSYQAQVRKN